MEKILRNFKEWQRVYQIKGDPDLELPNKITINILDFDLKTSFQLLSDAQREAIVLICLENRREIEAAQLMGFKKYSSQVGFLKRQGLKILADYYNELLGFDTSGTEYL
jgi:DNA-directed RNA polymerase specialized sigma24 family protein